MGFAAYYLNDPTAPKPNRPVHLGVNVLIEWDGKLLLERRKDCDNWGLPGGGVKGREDETKAIAREVLEETGLRIPSSEFQKIRVYGEPGRIASYRDGSVWRMVIVLYRAILREKPILHPSAESKELRFFTREELKNTQIVCTHQDLVAENWNSL